MSDGEQQAPGTPRPNDTAPGERPTGGEAARGLTGYVIGLLLAVGLSALSFWIGPSHLVWAPSIPVALIVLAIAQMGVHLVFFLHIDTAPDNTNNVLALAFGILIVFLVLSGSLWIMANLDRNMHPMEEIMRMQR